MQVVDMINNSTDLNLADLAITRLRDRFKLFADQDDPCILCLEVRTIRSLFSLSTTNRSGFCLLLYNC